ncbi:hypothetical protein [Roseimaritima ulvae]|uniref:Uncharacterized protein n=1 Tax=Roseimaritima ulvae TaxID=980254 RepID=A0A5B9QY21_9BACT|nr:hypothetical protein [Roseimaritima ulvae]QEG42295.1 hypothetical protein UC8_43290 [Roseimaritima ulvae]
MNRFPQRRHPLPLHRIRFRSAQRCVPFGCLLLGLAIASGCQQPNGQMNLPTNPMVGSTRVPAPPTGSVGAATGYAPATYAQTGIAAQPVVGLPASDLVPQFATPPATHYAAAPQSQFTPSPQIAPAAQLAPSPAAALQQAGYAETSAHGAAVAPTISLAPQLRGMAVNDLTPAGQAPYLQAQAQMQAQAQPQLPMQTTVQMQPQTGSPSAWSNPSTNLTPLPAPPSGLTPVPSYPAPATQAAAGQDSWNVVGSGVATPSTAPVVREASNSSASSSQDLPWRAPTTAR